MSCYVSRICHSMPTRQMRHMTLGAQRRGTSRQVLGVMRVGPNPDLGVDKPNFRVAVDKTNLTVDKAALRWNKKLPHATRVTFASRSMFLMFFSLSHYFCPFWSKQNRRGISSRRRGFPHLFSTGRQWESMEEGDRGEGGGSSRKSTEVGRQGRREEKGEDWDQLSWEVQWGQTAWAIGEPRARASVSRSNSSVYLGPL